MPDRDLQDFIQALEQKGMLRRIRTGVAALCILGACGDPAPPPPPPAPAPATPAPTTSPPPRRNLDPTQVIEGYILAPLDKFVHGNAPYPAPGYSPAEFHEALRKDCASLSSEKDLDRVFRHLFTFQRRRDLARLLKTEDRYVPPPDALLKGFLDSLAAAERIVHDALAARLRAARAADADFLLLARRCGLSSIPFLVTATVEEYLRLDRPEADRLIFEEAFFWISPARDRNKLWMPAALVIPMAVARDKARAARGFDAWLEATRQNRDLSGHVSPELIPIYHSLLDLDRSKDRFKKLSSHPYAYMSSSFLQSYLEIRRKDHPLTDADRADVLVGLAQSGRIELPDAKAMDSLLGKSFESTGDALVEAVARLFSSPVRPSDSLRLVLERFLPPSLVRMDARQHSAVFQRVGRTGPEEMRKLLTYFVRQTFADPGPHRAAIVRACAEQLGKDPKQNSEWLYLFRGEAPPECIADLSKAVLRDGIPVQTILSVLTEARLTKQAAAVLPAVSHLLRNRPDDVPEMLESLEKYSKVPELLPIADAFVDSFRSQARTTDRGRGFRRQVIGTALPPEAAPRLAAMIPKTQGKEARIDLFATILALNDKRVIRTLVDLVGRKEIPDDSADSLVRQLAGEPGNPGESLAQWFERVKSRLPPQVSPRE